jgi:hypothetical protein
MSPDADAFEATGYVFQNLADDGLAILGMKMCPAEGAEDADYGMVPFFESQDDAFACLAEIDAGRDDPKSPWRGWPLRKDITILRVRMSGVAP